MLAANSVLQGRYQIVRAIGQGGMGAVYEAKDLRDVERQPRSIAPHSPPQPANVACRR